MIRVSVLIPTFRRCDSFRRAARSVFAQIGVEGVELIAIDNSPEGSAEACFTELATEAPIPFRFAHEPRAGVAHARNAALALAQGALIAWLDDNEEAPPTWLAALIAARNATGAQSVFGPVLAQTPASGRWRPFVEGVYTREGPSELQLIDRAYGIGNSLQPRAMFDADEFDARANETGGEDDRLFAAWTRAGARFAWASDARVIEHVEGARAELGAGLKRAFAYGQGPCETAWDERDLFAIVRHMIIGAAQACIFSIAALIGALVRAPPAATYLDRATRGAGKVFWFVEQRFYGAASV